MLIEYKSSVLVDAGHRSVYIKAEAKKISDKKCQVLSVISIDDQAVGGYQSRTGAKRQRFNSDYIAKRETGAIKIISKLFNVIEA